MNPTEQNDKYIIIATQEPEKSVIEFEIEIKPENLAKHRNKVLKEMTAKAELPGFRKGHIPEKILVEKIGEMTILEDSAENAINEIMPTLIAEKHVNIVGQPAVTITSIAPGNPLRFKIKIPYLQEFILPDYKKIASNINGRKEEDLAVSEKEMDEAIERIRKIVSNQKGDKDKLPDLDDNFAKMLGNFKTLDEFKTKLKNDILADKKARAKEKKRMGIAETILAEIKIDLPNSLVESELNHMEKQMENDLERMGQKMEDYFGKIKKTREDLRKEWVTDAQNRIKLEIIVARIAEAEKLSPDTETIEAEAHHMMEHYKNVKQSNAEAYVEKIMTNQKVFEFLESCNI